MSSLALDPTSYCSTFISPAFRGEGGPMTRMPDLGLSPKEVDALIDYLLHP